MRIRKFRPHDLGEIAKLYYDTVHTINRRDYTDEQINAWAPRYSDTCFWEDRFKSREVFVVEEGIIVGFFEFYKCGHIDCFYVHHLWQGKGVGTLMLTHIENLASDLKLDRLFADVSITAKPFFLNKGFKITGEQEVIYNGVKFKNYQMEKHFHAPKTSSP